MKKKLKNKIKVEQRSYDRCKRNGHVGVEGRGGPAAAGCGANGHMTVGRWGGEGVCGGARQGAR